MPSLVVLMKEEFCRRHCHMSLQSPSSLLFLQMAVVVAFVHDVWTCVVCTLGCVFLGGRLSACTCASLSPPSPFPHPLSAYVRVADVWDRATV